MGFGGLRITRPPRDKTDDSVYINTTANNTSGVETHDRKTDGRRRDVNVFSSVSGP